MAIGSGLLPVLYLHMAWLNDVNSSPLVMKRKEAQAMVEGNRASYNMRTFSTSMYIHAKSTSDGLEI